MSQNDRDDSLNADDDWSPSDDRVIICECDICGEARLCCKTEDPYTSEIYPDEKSEEYWYCYPCWDKRHSDI